MNVVVKEPNKRPYVKEITPDPKNPDTIGLKPLQELVGGWIEYVPFDEVCKIDFVINEEGKCINLDSNFKYDNDIIDGTAVFVSSDEKGNTLGLTTEQIEYVLNSFGLSELLFGTMDFEEDTMFM